MKEKNIFANFFAGLPFSYYNVVQVRLILNLFFNAEILAGFLFLGTKANFLPAVDICSLGLINYTIVDSLCIGVSTLFQHKLPIYTTLQSELVAQISLLQT